MRHHIRRYKEKESDSHSHSHSSSDHEQEREPKRKRRKLMTTEHEDSSHNSNSNDSNQDKNNMVRELLHMLSDDPAMQSYITSDIFAKLDSNQSVTIDAVNHSVNIRKYLHMLFTFLQLHTRDDISFCKRKEDTRNFTQMFAIKTDANVKPAMIGPQIPQQILKQRQRHYQQTSTNTIDDQRKPIGCAFIAPSDRTLQKHSDSDSESDDDDDDVYGPANIIVNNNNNNTSKSNSKRLLQMAKACSS